MFLNCYKKTKKNIFYIYALDVSKISPMALVNRENDVKDYTQQCNSTTD